MYVSVVLPWDRLHAHNAHRARIQHAVAAVRPSIVKTFTHYTFRVTLKQVTQFLLTPSTLYLFGKLVCHK